MARDIVDIALIELDGTELQEIVSFDITETDPGAEVVTTMRRARRGLGFKQGVPTFEIDLEVKMVNPPEIDWLALKQDRTLFLLAYEENDGGQRFSIEDCLVTEVSKGFNSDGEATQSVKILALDHRKDL